MEEENRCVDVVVFIWSGRVGERLKQCLLEGPRPLAAKDMDVIVSVDKETTWL